MAGVEKGRSISLSMATDALMTGIDILLRIDSITLTSFEVVCQSQSSNITPLNQAFVLYNAFFSESQRCTFSFLLLARSLRTEGTSQVLQNSYALRGSKFDAKILTAWAIACDVHSLGRVRAKTSLQRSRFGMILNALGTFPLLYLLKIFPISPQTLLTSGLSSDFSQISFNFLSKAFSQSAWLSSGPNPNISNSPISASEMFPSCYCGGAIQTIQFYSVAASFLRCNEAFFFFKVLSFLFRSTAL